MFWDYDTQWGADRSRSGDGPKTWGHLEFSNTNQLLDVLAAYDIRACFAVVGAAALPGSRPYHDPQQVRRIFQAGHEIASHSFRHEWLPGLNRAALIQTLTLSKDAIEQCIGAPVISFVPPYNQPFEYARRASFSLSERRQSGPERTSLPILCQALAETGYRFCRVAYRPWPLRIADALVGRRLDWARPLEQIEGIWCARLNAPCGFAEDTRSMLGVCTVPSKILTVYGHPHSIGLPGAQNIQFLEPFLVEVKHLCSIGRLRASRPDTIIHEMKLQ
jgi:hypothetical protein